MGIKAEQQRRTTTSIISNPSQKTTNPLKGIKITQDWDKWLGWLQENDLQAVEICDYYFGTDRTKAKTNVEITTQGKFLLREMFIDAVNAGAIKFTPRINPQDFHFNFVDIYCLPRPRQLTVEYTPKTGARVTGSIDYHGEGMYKLQSASVKKLLYYFCVAIRAAQDSEFWTKANSV